MMNGNILKNKKTQLTKHGALFLAGILILGSLCLPAQAADLSDRISVSTYMAEEVTYTIADFMEWMEETQDLTEDMKTDIENAQELLEGWVESEEIDLKNEDDATNLNNIWYAILSLGTCETLIAADENFPDGDITTTNFTMMVGSAYVADISSTSSGHQGKNGVFSYNENLEYYSIDPAAAFFDEKELFDACRDELGYEAPVSYEQKQEITSLAKSYGWEVGHYLNIKGGGLLGIGVCTYPHYLCGSSNSGDASTAGSNAEYTVAEFKAYFEEYYESLYGEDSLTQAEDLISLYDDLAGCVIGTSDSAASTGESFTYYYTGFAVEPSISVYVNDDHTQLVEGTDYIITYEDNIEPGTATMIIKGINDCVGYLIKTFEIVDSNGFITLGDQTYYYIDNVRQYGWITADDEVYYLDEETGVMQTGWQTIGGEIYYFASSGEMQTGKCKINDAYYYFDEDTGVMQYGWVTVGSKVYYFDEDTGAEQFGLVTIDGETYYFSTVNSGAKYGVMQYGWQTIDDDLYYFDEDTGVMQTGLQTIGGKTYYFDESGIMQSGLVTINGNTYYFEEYATYAYMVSNSYVDFDDGLRYFDEDGVMAVGWYDTYYYYDESGVMLTGWQTIDGETYYFDELGMMQTGLIVIDGNYYYFDEETGIMQTGFVLIEDAYYYFDEDGIMQTGWVTINGNTYYFDPVMQTGSVGINGVQYYFDEETGILQTDENDSSSNETSGGTTGTTDGSSSTNSNDGDVTDSSGSGKDLDSNVSDSGSDNTEGSDGDSADGISRARKAQKITIKKNALKKTVKAKKLKKKNQTFKLKASTSGNGKITYKKVSGNKKIKVSKTGKVTVKKGLKKGKTYKVKVKVTAAKTVSCKTAAKVVTLKVKVK